MKFAVAYLYGRPGLLDGRSEDAASLGRVEITAARVAEAQKDARAVASSFGI